MSRLLILDPGTPPERVRSELHRRGIESHLLVGSNQHALLVTDPGDVDDVAGVVTVLDTPSAHPLVDGAPSRVGQHSKTVTADGVRALMGSPSKQLQSCFKTKASS